MKPVPDDDVQRPSPEDFKRMSFEERQAVVAAGVVEHLDAASPEIQAFAKRARQRYLATVVD